MGIANIIAIVPKPLKLRSKQIQTERLYIFTKGPCLKHCYIKGNIFTISSTLNTKNVIIQHNQKMTTIQISRNWKLLFIRDKKQQVLHARNGKL